LLSRAFQIVLNENEILMKRTTLLLVIALGVTLPVFSQDKAPGSASTYIQHTLYVPEFTPPAPVEAKRLPNIRVDATCTLPSSNGKTLTLQRGEASTLPDLPPPPPPEPIKQARELTPAELARIAYQRRHNLNLGASVYDHKVSIVRWTDPETATSYEATCGFDIGLLAGIGTFIHQQETYSVFLMHSDYDTTRKSRFAYPSQPTQVQPGQILITTGDPKNTAATAPLAIIRDLITAEKEHLTTFQAARLKHQQAAAAWEAEHPPIPRDETIVLRPHRGSRYLAEPQPEQKGDTTR
jgi:hypothetical protein